MVAQTCLNVICTMPVLLLLLLLLLYNMDVSCHRHFFLILLLNQQWSPPLRLQASHCSTFHIMCDVPSIAVFCSESIECFPGTASKFILKLLVTIPGAAVFTGTIVHFRFHILCISTHELLYFNFSSPSFLLSAVLSHLPACMFSFFFVFNYYIWPICCNFSVCVYCLIPQHCDISLSSHTGLGMCVYHLSVVSAPKALHIE